MSELARPLLDAAAQQRLHHSLILHGPVGRELREMALAIAKALNCVGDGHGDDGCSSCRKISENIHPDVQTIEVRSDRKMISVEQVRELVAAAALRPYEGRNKVFIIDPVDAISNQGANALLKTLEEPVASTTFILLTRSPDRLLQTIRSRSQIVAVRPRARFLPADEVENRGVSMQEARLAAGAVSEEDWQGSRELSREMLDLLHEWASRRDTSALIALGALLGTHEDPAWAGGHYIGFLRDLLGVPADESVDPARFAEIQQKIGTAELHRSARSMAQCLDMMSVNIDTRNAFEGAVLDLVPPRR